MRNFKNVSIFKKAAGPKESLPCLVLKFKVFLHPHKKAPLLKEHKNARM
jgi:hypothetical protein